MHVVVDTKGQIMGAIAQGATTPEGDQAVIRPARRGHRLHEIDLSESAMKLPADEFLKHLQGRVPKA